MTRPYSAVTDLGFYPGGGVNPPRGEWTQNFAKFSQKLHEILKNLDAQGVCVPQAPPPPYIRHYIDMSNMLEPTRDSLLRSKCDNDICHKFAFQ